MAMPSTYASDRMKACIWVILWPRPTMMPDRIGIIGNTHGVNASNNPAPKKKETISQKLPPLNSRAICEPSDTGACDEGGGASVMNGGASWPVVASGRLMCNVLVMGGEQSPCSLQPLETALC